MKIRYGYLFLMTTTILLLVLFVALSVAEQPTFARPAAELHVCPAGAPTCDFATIQEAVDAANPGDVIKVATGTYTGVHTQDMHTQHLFIDKTVTIVGGYNPPDWETKDPALYPTTLDAGTSGRVVYVDDGVVLTLDGLKLTMGDAAGQGGGQWDEDAGGGFYAEGSAITLNGCWFVENTAQAGGGVYIKDGNGLLVGNRFISNSAKMNDSGSYGDGGGLLLNHVDAELAQNHFMLNSAGYAGSAIYAGFDSEVTMTNDALVVNEIEDRPPFSFGCALFAAGSTVDMIHSTVNGNFGGNGIGVCADSWPSASTVNLTNAIIVNQTVGVDVSDGSSATIDGVLWYANSVGNTDGAVSISHAYNGDPRFLQDGYHLTAGSAAIDNGIDAGVNNDIDSQPRPQGAGPDLGADEFRSPTTPTPVSITLYLPLLMK